jgi:hypothetical protein
MAIVILPTIAPNLPVAPTEYSQKYINELTNALRLYFRSIDNFTLVASQNITVTVTVSQWLGL